MPEKRRKFSPQFKAEAVQRVIETGSRSRKSPVIWVSMTGRLGIWLAAWRDANPEPSTALSPIDRVRVSEMEAEIR